MFICTLKEVQLIYYVQYCVFYTVFLKKEEKNKDI